MIPSFLKQSSFCSFLTQNIKPSILTLPLSYFDIGQFSLSSVPTKRTDQTLLQIYKNQNSFPLTALIHIIFLILIGLVLTYISILLIVLSLFNPVLFFIAIFLIFHYVKWSVKGVNSHRKKASIKIIKKWLQKQNKEFYSRKLIRWVYDPDHNHIIVHNLRLCN